MLYNRSGVAVLDVRSIYPESNLSIGPSEYDVRGGEVNVTLAPGTYVLHLYNGSTLSGNRTVSLVGGEYLAITMGHVVSPWPVWFNETGLPQGTPWSITVGDRTFSSTNGSIQFLSGNGSFPYQVGAIVGYHLGGFAYSGALDVAGHALAFLLKWTRVVYPITAATFALPLGVPWSIAIDNHTYTSTSGSVAFSLANGTYPYVVEVAYRYVAIDPSDVLPVMGEATSINVSFAPRYATLTGTASPAAATVSINGTVEETGQATFHVSAPSGPYEVTAQLSGYRTFYQNVTLTPGNTTVVTVRLVALVTTPSSPGPSTPTSSAMGWTTADTFGIGVAILVIVALAAGILWSRARRRR
jgi:hypothetical protein